MTDPELVLTAFVACVIGLVAGFVLGWIWRGESDGQPFNTRREMEKCLKAPERMPRFTQRLATDRQRTQP